MGKDKNIAISLLGMAFTAGVTKKITEKHPDQNEKITCVEALDIYLEAMVDVIGDLLDKCDKDITAISKQ